MRGEQSANAISILMTSLSISSADADALSTTGYQLPIHCTKDHSLMSKPEHSMVRFSDHVGPSSGDDYKLPHGNGIILYFMS